MTVFINRQLIYPFAEELFAMAGVVSVEHADFEGVERLALALGGNVMSTFDSPDRNVALGHCDLVDTVMIGEDVLVRFSGLPRGEACTVVLRGSSQHLLDEAHRSLHDALCVVSQTVLHPEIVFGAGCSEALMAEAVGVTPLTLERAVEAEAAQEVPADDMEDDWMEGFGND